MGVPLRGVVHAAGVLEDGILLDMTPDRLARVLAPKIAGAWNLHRATSDAPLERFVLFSSVAALLGSPGQGNYAAGNAFLDGLAHYRRAQGLPALSINWGPWAGSGMAASGERSENVAARGMELLPADAALETLGRLLTGDAATVAVMDARWPALVRQLPGGTPPLLESVAPAQEKTSGERATESAFRAQLLQVGLDERKTILREYVTEELSRIIGIEPSQLDAGQPLNTLGLDSLMAMELKNKLETQLACTLPMAKFLEGPSVASLADFAAGLLSGEAEPSDASHEQPARSESWTPLIALQTAGARPPLFCVHPLGGDVRCYDGIAQAMAGERPVYAVRARGSEGDLPPHQSIDEMVRDYLAAIRAVQPSGPYHLCGWSTGGIYAYEMARQLEAAGEELGLLALFDSPLPTICENIDLHDDTRFLFDLVEFTNQFAGAAMRVSYEALRSQSYEASFEQAMAEAKRHGVVPADVPIAFLRRLVDVAKSNVRVLRDYQPAALRQPIHLFRPLQAGLLEEKLGPNIEADLGWGRVAGGPVELHEAPGHHFSMMLGENAQVLSELLAKAERGGRKAEGGEG